MNDKAQHSGRSQLSSVFAVRQLACSLPDGRFRRPLTTAGRQPYALLAPVCPAPGCGPVGAITAADMRRPGTARAKLIAPDAGVALMGGGTADRVNRDPLDWPGWPVHPSTRRHRVG